MRRWFRAQIAVLALALGGLAYCPSVSATDDVIQAKVGLDWLSKEQQLVLWQRVERFASMESFASFCGKPSQIERRVVNAVSSCVTPTSLQQVVTQFRRKLHERNGAITADHSVCEEQRIKTLVKEIHTAIDTLVSEVARMCKSCLIC